MTQVTITGTVRSNTQGKFGREIVIETGSKYPDPIQVEVSERSRNFAEWAALQEGACVAVGGALRGREHAGKYYTNVSGYSFELIGGGKSPF